MLNSTRIVGEQSVMGMSLQSDAFVNGERIPRKYTGDGEDLSPPLKWSGIPEKTEQLVLICVDPDAVTPEPWVHWVLYEIPADTTEIPEGLPTTEELDVPAGALQGKNSWPHGKTTGYRGPMPPQGDGIHHYHFRLYALDKRFGFEPALGKQTLLSAMAGHILAETELVGTYEK